MNFDSKKKVSSCWKKFLTERKRVELTSKLLEEEYRETRALEPTFRNLTPKEKEDVLISISNLQKYLNRQKNYLSKISKELRKD